MTRRNGLLSTLAMVVVGAVVGTMVVSCGIRPSVVIPGQEAPHGVLASLTVYLLDHNKLRAVSRPLPPTSADGTVYSIPYPSTQQALNALMDGPTATETAGGLTSELPAKGFATVLSASASVYRVFVKAGDADLSQNAVDQVVCTVVTAVKADGYQRDTDIQVQVFTTGNGRRAAESCPANTP